MPSFAAVDRPPLGSLDAVFVVWGGSCVLTGRERSGRDPLVFAGREGSSRDLLVLAVADDADGAADVGVGDTDTALTGADEGWRMLWSLAAQAIVIAQS